MGGYLHLGESSSFNGKLGEVVSDVVGQGLCVGGRARTATPNVIVKLGNFVRGSIGHVGASGDARVYRESILFCLVRGERVRIRSVQGSGLLNNKLGKR